LALVNLNKSKSRKKKTKSQRQLMLNLHSNRRHTRGSKMSENANGQEKGSANDLLEKVDAKFETSLRKIYFSRKLPFRYYAKFFTLGFLLAIYFIAAYLLSLIANSLPSSFSLSTPSETLILAISMVATLIALASFAASLIDVFKPESEYEIWTSYNYEVLKENVSPEELPLLKGLVMLKSKHPKILLAKFLSPLDKSLTNKKLFEILYGK
jgi:hypothetical protein